MSRPHGTGRRRTAQPQREPATPAPHCTRPALPAATTLALALGGFAPGAAALSFMVTNADDAGNGSLREAIAQANLNPGADDIVFDLATPATITLSTGQLEIFDDLTITGPGADQLTVDGDGSSRIFFIDGAGGALGSIDVDISGLTLTNGFAAGPQADDSNGGAIRGENVDLLIDSAAITNSVASADGGEGRGGGIALREGDLTLYHSEVAGNVAGIPAGHAAVSGGATTAGGGIWLANGELNVQHSTVTDNLAGNAADQPDKVFFNAGGGIAATNATTTIYHSTVSGNTAGNAATGTAYILYGAGGGIASDGNLSLHHTTISGNLAGNAGAAGAVYSGGAGILSDGDLYVHDSTISGNTAGDAAGAADYTLVLLGGGITHGDGEMSLHNCTVSGNTLVPGLEHYELYVSGGAGIFSRTSATVTIESCTVAHNDAGDFPGGGMFDGAEGIVNVHNTLVADNLGAPDHVDLGDPAFYGGASATFLVTWSLIGTTGAVAIDDSAAPGSNLLDQDPLLDPLADNGGTTQTHALQPASPAIDAADPGDFPATDQRGVARPQGAGPDIGAFEFGVPLAALLDFFDAAVDEGTLVGSGPSKSAANRLNALRNMLATAATRADDGDIAGACDQLLDAYLRTDGQSPPSDFVAGAAAGDLAAQIAAARASLGCNGG